MENLIKALTIFLKYGNPKFPTYCDRETMYVNINPELVSEEDKIELEKLGFIEDKEGEDLFKSYKFGSF